METCFLANPICLCLFCYAMIGFFSRHIKYYNFHMAAFLLEYFHLSFIIGQNVEVTTTDLATGELTVQ